MRAPSRNSAEPLFFGHEGPCLIRQDLSMSIRFKWIAFCSLMIPIAGCFGGPSRVDAPEFDAGAAASAAISLYDSNGDGELDDTELKATPSLGNALDEMDGDSSGTLSEAEIRTRVEYFVQSRTGRMSLACRVVKGNRAIPNAVVTFEPEPFMADMVQTASGTTMENGMAMINIDDQLGGVQPGFYKVRISQLSPSGKERLPAKYNAETTLGQEVTTGSMALAEGLVFQL